MVAYAFRMPAGIAGDVNRAQQVVIRPEIIGATTPPTAYGQAVVIDATSGLLRTPTTTDATINGFLARPFPTNSVTPGALGATTPPTSAMGDLMMRGFMSVLLQNTTPAINGGQVYVYVGATGGSRIQGGIEAAAGANLIAITGCLFSGPADANGFTEISYLP